MEEVLHNSFKNDIAEHLKTHLDQVFADSAASISIKDIYNALTPPPQDGMGDIAFPCFPLAKKLRKAPVQIAEELRPAFTGPQTDQMNFYAKEEKGPYVNFIFKTGELAKHLLTEINSHNFFKKTLTQDAPRTMFEYSQPNTHKEIHVGHMRNLALGNALVRIYKYCSYPTMTSTYPGDVGTHVAKTLWYFQNFPHEKPPEDPKIRGAWLGKMYALATQKIEEAKGTPQEAEIKNSLTKILQDIEHREGETYELWKETRQWSINLMKDIYKWAHVDFDKWYFESEVDTPSKILVQQYYERGIFVKSEGAVGIDLSEDKLGFCLLLKSDGNGLYATKDIELAKRKFQDDHIEKNIYIVDKRQAHHFKQVFKVLEKMGFSEAKNCYHLQYDYVALPEGALSSRKGNIIPIQELIHKMEDTITNLYLSRYKDEWSSEKIQDVAHQVAEGAIKYGMLRIDPSRAIIFDMNEWLKIDGESGPYIQYTHARINSILEQYMPHENKNEETDFSQLTHALEKNLLMKLSLFNDVVLSVSTNYKVHLICAYLYELSKSFNSFYAELSIGREPNPSIRKARLELALGIKNVLSKGLELLGIQAPNKM